MKNVVYTVTAYRYGDREKHSYVVGVYSKKGTALDAASEEEDYRGGKYSCEITQHTMDTTINTDTDFTFIQYVSPRSL